MVLYILRLKFQPLFIKTPPPPPLPLPLPRLFDFRNIFDHHSMELDHHS